MKVAILHQDLEWAEKQMKLELESKGVNVNLFDVRVTSSEDLLKYDLVLNRVYASTANRNYIDNLKTLEILKELEERGVKCLNSHVTSLCDYSKFISNQKMNEHNVSNPKTILINNKNEIEKAKISANELGYPLIVKRDMGGRGKDVYRVDSEVELMDAIVKIYSEGEGNTYNGGVVLQEFLKSVRKHDCRISIIDGKFAFSYKRNLISDSKGKEPWIASCNMGSVQSSYDPSGEEIELAIKATESIGANSNEVDMVFTKDGPAIIENNPTPNYIEGEDTLLIEKAVDLILKEMIVPIKLKNKL